MTSARVLVVEDERIIAFGLGRVLQRLGYTVVGTAADAASALRLVGQYHPDLVLMDVHLDGPVDGIVAASRIREQFDVPSVFLSAYSDEETRARSQAARPVGFIFKPFEVAEVDRVIQHAMAVEVQRRHDSATDSQAADPGGGGERPESSAS